VSTSISNQTAAEALEEVAILLRIAGANEFKAIAFDKAARTIESLDESIVQLTREGRLNTIPGIGKSIASDLEAFVQTGTMPVLEDLRSSIPSGLLQWLNISGLGPKNIAKIYQALQITEIHELKEACQNGSVANLPGLGEKSALKILKSIEWMEHNADRCRLDEAAHIAKATIRSLEKTAGILQVSVAGSFRRGLETIGDIDILVDAEPKYTTSIFDAFVYADDVVEILGRGETKCSIRVKQGRQVDLRIVESKAYPAALMYFTGSKEHNVFLRGRARDRGMALNEYGLFFLNDSGETDFERPIPISSEEDIYQHLGLHFIPPELRENPGDLIRFETETADKLITEADLKGILHAHSTWSDGSYSIKEMALACIERGYQYLGITDHSRTAAYAGGLSTERVFNQWREIDTLNDEFAQQNINFRILKGIESDILPDGTLDYDDEVLAGFDVVIASVHASLDMPEDKMMERFFRAIENKYSNIIGHPTGRLLLKRAESKLDMNSLIEHAATHHTAIEINANPWRLDLDWRWGRKARQEGLFSAICPDAHSIEGIDDTQYGIKIARKAGFSPKMILNTLDVDELLQWLRH
jgi:DNA polymerase (family X)